MISIGTDIIKTKRVKKLINEKGDVFLKKIFTSKEIAYCTSNSNPHIHFSGKYAAKEAVKKALLSNSLIDKISLKDIEILNKNNKAPYVVIEDMMELNYNISISHEEEYAIAFVVIEK